jgi:hypothetical protein
MMLMPISYLSQLLKVTHQLRILSKLDFATSKPVGNCLEIGFKGLGLVSNIFINVQYRNCLVLNYKQNGRNSTRKRK